MAGKTPKARLIAATAFLLAAMVFWTVMAVRYASRDILIITIFTIGFDVLVVAVGSWLLMRR